MYKVTNALYDLGVAFIILLAVVLCLLPVMHVAAVSLSSNRAIINDEVTILPVEINLQSYEAVFSNPAMLQSMLVTIVMTATYTVLAMVLTVLAAYPLTKKWLPGRNIILFVFLFTLLFGGGDIPNYLLMKDLKLLNTLWVLILPMALSIWNMIILKTFLSSIPDSLMESAHIDGANEFTVLIRIVLPLSLPVIASLSLFYAVLKWNSFQDALYYITAARDLEPVQLKLYKIIMDLESPNIAIDEGAMTQTNLFPESLKAASVMFATIPIVCLYPWLQKYFIKGLTIGSIKG
jgi:putative aldouronate transport system permease protein